MAAILSRGRWVNCKILLTQSFFVIQLIFLSFCTGHSSYTIPDSKVHGANMEPIWGRQDPGGLHVGPMNFAIWDCAMCKNSEVFVHQHRSYGQMINLKISVLLLKKSLNKQWISQWN